MKTVKRVLGTGVFLGIGLLMFVAVSYMLRPVKVKTKVDNFYRVGFTGFYEEEKNSLDIVSFGASGLSYFMDNPMLWDEFQLTAYNLGTSNQSCFILEHMIDEVEKTQSPQLYIVETRKFLFAEEKSYNKKSFPYVIDNMKYSWNRIKLINYLTDDWEERLNYYFDIISYHDSWEDFSSKNLEYLDNEIENETKGWKTQKKIKKMKLPQVLPVAEEDAVAIPTAAEAALVSLMEKCKKENIQVLFLATPWKIDKESQQKNKYIEGLVEEAGFQFLDCNQYIEEIGLDGDTDFWDRKHTNVIGAEKVTRFVGNYIQENYELSTEHSEEVIVAWNQIAAENRAEAQSIKEKLLGE